MKKEIWKDIKGWKGSYQVSNLGRVRSLGWKRKAWIPELNIYRYNYMPGVIRKPVLHYDGYLYIILNRGKKYKRRSAHYLVLSTFKGIMPRPYQIGHKNHIKTDNRLCNLKWVTPKQNCIDNRTNKYTGLMPPWRKLISREDVEYFKLMRNDCNMSDMAELFQIPRPVIYDICLRKNWDKHRLPRKKPAAYKIKPRMVKDIIKCLMVGHKPKNIAVKHKISLASVYLIRNRIND